MLAGICTDAALGQRAPSAQAIHAAIDRGVESLRESAVDRQQPYGAGSAALYLYALLKSGVDGEDPLVHSLVSQLAFSRLTGSYDRACAILALDALDRHAFADWINELSTGLIASQNDEGGWGYPMGEDLSNIQYAALGLWAGERSGSEVPAKTWERLADRLRHYKSGKGYGYRGGSSPTGSMGTAAAGVASILLYQPEIEGKLRSRVKADSKRALGWLDQNFAVDRNPKLGDSWLYYYLYGLERAGALAGLKFIGDHDWYAEGAGALLRRQKPDGGWGAGPVQTSFALLFLTRATGPVTGQKRATDKRVAGVATEDSAMTFVAAGDTPLRMWIAAWNDERVARSVWPGEEGQGPRVVKVEYLAGQTLLAVVDGSSAGPAGAARFAAQHSFREPGSYEVRARAHLLLPRINALGTAMPGLIVQVDSVPVAVSIQKVVPEWLRLQRAEQKSVWGGLKPEIQASSYCRGGGQLPIRAFGAGDAMDGSMRTPWLAEEGDAKPTWGMVFPRKVRVAGLRLYGARSTPHRLGAFRRPLEALVSVDGGDYQRVRMHVDERRAGILDFPKGTWLRTVEIVLNGSAPGEEYDLTGLAEVQLLKPEK